MSSRPISARPPLQLLSVVIPARDEEGCIASTVEHLYLELRLNNITHEIIVVDDGSTDATWTVLESLKHAFPVLRPVQNLASHGFGRAVVCGFDHMAGEAVCRYDGRRIGRLPRRGPLLATYSMKDTMPSSAAASSWRRSDRLSQASSCC